MMTIMNNQLNVTASVFRSGILFLTIALSSIGFNAAHAACQVLQSNGDALSEQDDPLFHLLTQVASCPSDVFEFRAAIFEQGGTLQAAMVANQGFNNPGHGNFSVFESVQGTLASSALAVESGQFFFGHFTEPRNGVLTASESMQDLMIELIVWDHTKQMFNFYELIGNGQSSDWFYRGDTSDVLQDNEHLHRQADANNPQFGSRLRCSGCHMSGGPIMKELEPPYNDWWTDERGLAFGDWEIGTRLREILESVVDAGKFASQVKDGMTQLQDSDTIQAITANSSLQVQLRPLFCTVEVNLESDGPDFWRGPTDLSVPAGFFIDQLFSNDSLIVGQKEYASSLSHFNPNFPGNGIDADHAWLTPVKSFSDRQAIASLVRNAVADSEFVADVLAIDYTRPMFSDQRCALLSLVPENDDGNWRRQFLDNLNSAAIESDDERIKSASNTLMDHITNPMKSAKAHRIAVNDYLAKCTLALDDDENRMSLIKYLLQKRQEVASSEISANRLGQIFELDGFEGFKRLFPDVTGASEPGEFKLNADCKLVSAS